MHDIIQPGASFPFMFFVYHNDMIVSSVDMGILTKTISYNIIRYHGQCLYFQCIPSDGFLDEVVAEGPNATLGVRYVKFTSQENDKDGSVHRSWNTVTAELSDPYGASGNDICQFGYNSALGLESPKQNEFYIYVNVTKIPVSVPVDEPIHLRNIDQLQFSGHIVACKWLGMSAKISLKDSQAYCAAGLILPNILAASDLRCGHMELALPMEKQTSHDLLLSESMYPLKTDQYIVENMVWHFSINSITHQVDQFLIIQLGVNKCFNVMNSALSVKIYSVIQILKRGGVQRDMDISYLSMDSYQNVLNETFIINPTFYSTGMYVNPTWFASNCIINMSYYHQLMQFHQTPINISYLSTTFENPADPRYYMQWRMCWYDRCYLMRDDKFIPTASSWNEADLFCRTKGGHLLSINSDAEQAAVLQWILNKRRLIVDNDQYGFSTIWTRSWMVFLGLHIDKQVSKMIMYFHTCTKYHHTPINITNDHMFDDWYNAVVLV
jgi:hypothetical protein